MINNNKKLFFGQGNAKLSKSIATFSLPAGHSCPMANLCLSKADRITGKISDGKNTKFRCFAASEEAIFPTVRRARWRNFEMLKKESTIENMANLIQKSLPFEIGIVRCHVSGDFFNEKYFLAWLNVALNNPGLIIYGYTKMLTFFVKYKKEIPKNFRFTTSKGGKSDNLISKYKMKYAEVVFSIKEAVKKKLEIDHNDSHAIYGKRSFGLLLHGRQLKGSDAGRAMKELKGTSSYSDKNKKKFNVDKIVEIRVR